MLLFSITQWIKDQASRIRSGNILTELYSSIFLEKKVKHHVPFSNHYILFDLDVRFKLDEMLDRFLSNRSTKRLIQPACSLRSAAPEIG